MSNIWTIAKFELQRQFRSRGMVINQFLLPIILIFLLGTALSGVVGQGKDITIDPVHVAIVDAAGSKAAQSQLVAELLKAPEAAKVIIPETVKTRSEAEEAVRAGKYGYAVVVPAGFDQQVKSGKDAKLEYILGKDRTDNMVAGTVFDNFLSQINYSQAAALTLGPAAAVPASAADGGAESAVVGKLNDKGRSYTASQYYAASMLIMFLLTCGQTMISSLYSEKDNHTLFRLNSMPLKGSELFMGKMLGMGLISVVQSAVIIIATHFLFGVYWGNRPLALALVCLLVILISLMLSVVIAMTASNAATARNISMILTVLMTFISGGMTQLPDSWVNTGGAFSVNHWGMKGILRMMLESPWAQISGSIGMLAAISGGLLCIAFISYRKVGYHA
ncbi:ABC-2 family transporter protein [compost metagenome]